MNIDELRLRLEANGAAIVGLLEGVQPEEAAWSGVASDAAGGASDVVRRWSAEERWSLLQIVRHLVVEECDDFRARLSSVLRNPDDPFPSFEWPFGPEDAPGRELDLSGVVQVFNRERAASLEWLGRVDNFDPDVLHRNPAPGTQALRAGDIVAAWVAHDFFHIRQIVNLRWMYLEHSSAPYSSRYAGEFLETVG